MKEACKGSELIFISRIKRDGSGIEPVDQEYVELMRDEIFELIRLSITQDIYIAGSMNCFVVKKNPAPPSPVEGEKEMEPYFKLGRNEYGYPWLLYKPCGDGRYDCWLQIDEKFYSEFEKLLNAPKPKSEGKMFE